MNKHTPILSLVALATLTYCVTAYTRPQEPAGRALHAALRHLPEADLPRIPFSGLLDWDNGYQHRPTLRPLQVVPATCTPYTPEELSEIYPTH